VNAAEREAPTMPAPPDLPRQCPCCGAVLPLWETLAYVGVQDFGDGRPLELRNHACGSTVARELTPAGEHRRDEGDDLRDEERAERFAEWRDGPGRW